MKLLRFKDKSNEQTRVGAIKDKNIVDLSEVAKVIQEVSKNKRKT